MSPPRQRVRKVDPGFAYTWYHPKEADDVKQEECENTNLATNPSHGVIEKINQGSVNETDFDEAKEEEEEEAVRPKRTWTQMINEALTEAEDKRLPTEGVYSYIRQNYPYFTKDAERWEKARTALRNTLSKYGYKKVEGNFWALHSYDGPDVVAEKNTTKSALPFCKTCGKVMHHSNPERHELVCGKPHLVSLMLGKITFCRDEFISQNLSYFISDILVVRILPNLQCVFMQIS